MTDIAKPPVNHATIVLERQYEASPARVFAAFADPAARTRWGVPSNDAELVYDETEFRVGGCDVGRCGPRGKLACRVETRYHDIIPDHRIVYTEVVSQGLAPLSFALVTVDFEADPGGCRLILTDQVTSYGGEGMIGVHRACIEATLENLRMEFKAAAVG